MPDVPDIRTPRLELVSLSAAFVDALLGGRRGEAERLAGVTLPDGWPDEHDAGFLRLRADQMRAGRHEQRWLVRAVALREPGRPVIGHAGFHGNPGTNARGLRDAVEIGYSVFPEHRGRGYATEAVVGLLGWARGEGIRRFVASVAPANEPSLAIVRRLGFREVGAHWDEEDGEELELELTVDD